METIFPGQKGLVGNAANLSSLKSPKTPKLPGRQETRFFFNKNSKFPDAGSNVKTNFTTTPVRRDDNHSVELNPVGIIEHDFRTHETQESGRKMLKPSLNSNSKQPRGSTAPMSPTLFKQFDSPKKFKALLEVVHVHTKSKEERRNLSSIKSPRLASTPIADFNNDTPTRPTGATTTSTELGYENEIPLF